MTRLLKICALVIVAGSCLAPRCNNQNQVSLPTEDELAKHLKPNQTLVHYEREFLAGLNREIVRAKVLDEKTNGISELIRTTKKGEQHDYLTLRTLNRAAIRAIHGGGGMGFDAAMDQKPDAEFLFTVQLVPNADRPQAKQEISRRGASIKNSFSDILSIRASPAAAKKIARLKSVLAIVEERPPTLLALDMARDLDQTPLAQKHAEGWGRNLLAAIWEPNACLNRAHPDFKKVQWENRFTETCQPDGLPFRFHSTMVAGVFAAFRPEGTVGLFQGRLFDVNGEDVAATEDMWARKPNIVNASFTTPVFDGRRIDQEVWNTPSIHVFTAVGNNSTNGEQITCFGYNALCVGGYNANVVGGYADDVMGPTSWKNVAGVEKPQILGPYDGKKLPTEFFSGGPPVYKGAGGSSFATPAVAGLAALLIANYEGQLLLRASAVRAVLMASAHVHPIKSEDRVTPDFNDNIDDKMGVGAPNGSWAKKIMDNQTLSYGRFPPRVSGTLGPTRFTANRGDSVRVVVTWDQCPDYNIVDPDLSADLDLVVTAPGSPGPGSSRSRFTNLSQDDNWEIVQFTMPASGEVSVTISTSTFRPCYVSQTQDPRLLNYAIAWSIMPATLGQ